MSYIVYLYAIHILNKKTTYSLLRSISCSDESYCSQNLISILNTRYTLCKKQDVEFYYLYNFNF